MPITKPAQTHKNDHNENNTNNNNKKLIKRCLNSLMLFHSLHYYVTPVRVYVPTEQPQAV